MTDTLSPDQIRLLKLPFAASEHRFTPQGQVYLIKQAIRQRIDLVDPGWQLLTPELIMHGEGVVVLRGALVICGVERYNVGTGIIQQAKPNEKTGEINTFLQSQFVAKAYKTAASDLLPRCALEFGVGAYLKAEAVSRIRTPEALASWLKNLPQPPGANGKSELAQQMAGK